MTAQFLAAMTVTTFKKPGVNLAHCHSAILGDLYGFREV